MPVTVQVNFDNFRRRVDMMRKRGYAAREAYIMAMGSVFVNHVVKASPVDTHRYVRAWMQAAEGAGLKVGNLPKITPTKRRAAIEAILAAQLRATREQYRLEEFKLAVYEQADREGKQRPKIGYYNKLVNRIYEAKARAEAARQELYKWVGNENAIAMMRGSGAALNGYQRNIKGTALNLTVREKIYGGRGRLIRGNTRTGIRLHNLEPHCMVVERFKGPVRRGRAAMSAAGLQKLKPEYVAQLTRNTRGFARFGAGLRRNGII